MLIGLSKSLQEALKYMATHQEVNYLARQLEERVELHKTIADGPPEIELDPHDPVDWMEGVEHLQTKTEDELYEMLGFEDKKIPFLASEIDIEPDVAPDAASNEDADDIAPVTQAAEKQPMALKWHQLVGVVKMVERALTSNPILLMDDVGLGKTLQVIALFAVMAYYRQFHAKAGKYPGLWGTHIRHYKSTHAYLIGHRDTTLDVLCRGAESPAESSIPHSCAAHTHKPGRGRMCPLLGERIVRCYNICLRVQDPQGNLGHNG